MKKVLYFLQMFLLLGILQSEAKTQAPAPAKMTSQMGALPLIFTENRGQVADMSGKPRPDILFTAHSGHTNIFLAASGISYQFSKITYPLGYNPSDVNADPEKQAELEKQIQTQTYNFSLTLEGANPHPNIVKEDKSITEFNFYLTQCPNGLTHVASYQKLTYQEVYPNIDWVVYSDGNHLKYDFIVKAGGDPSLIKLKIKDAQGVSITRAGELLMTTSLGEIKEQAPLSYVDGKLIKSNFKQNADGTIGFDVATQKGKTLRIDPAVVWSTYYGGTGADVGNGCAVDGSGNVYLAGTAASTAGIASGGSQNTIGGGTDAFLAKFDANGYLVWATYYGGTAAETGCACATDGSGNIYLEGVTASTGLAIGGFQNTIGGSNDIFLVKFNTSGTRQWATYYGTTGAEGLTAGTKSVCTDATGNVYITGLAGGTSSSSLALNGYQSSGANCPFLAEFNTSGTRLWGTYYSGTGSGTISSTVCTADANGYVYLGGFTSMATNVASGGFQNTLGGTAGANQDAFLIKFNPSLSTTLQRIWSTYYGGSGSETANDCVVDAIGNVILGGITSTATPNANIIASTSGFQTTSGGSTDGFLVKFDSSGNRTWGTYYGGTGVDQFKSVLIDASGNIYASGFTSSSTNIDSAGFQPSLSGSSDLVLVKFDSTGNRIWGSYCGGTSAEQGGIAARDTLGNIYLAGQATASGTSAIPGTYQSASGGSTDAILVKVGNTGLFTSTSIASPLCAGSTISVPFTLFGTYNSGNVFTAQLSNASGSFATPVNLGTLTGTAAGSISATIPANTAVGTSYRIRITSTNPAIIAPNNGTNLAVNICCIPSSDTVHDTICNSSLPFVWNGHTIATGGNAVAVDTFTNAGGCDSVVTLNLVVNPTITHTDSVAICGSALGTYSWNGHTGLTPGPQAAIDTFPAATGCDSIVTLNLSIINSSSTTVNDTICHNLPFIWNGLTVNSTGAFAAIYHTTNAAGCDSSVALNLTVQVDTAQANITIASSQLPYTWNGITVSSGGTAVAAYTTAASGGCDSVTILNLTVTAPAPVALASWVPTGLSAYGPSPWTATASDSNVTVVGLTRGAGVTTPSGAAAAAWGGSGWTGGATQDVTFSVAANTNHTISLSSLNLFYRRSGTGPSTGTLQYSLDGGSSYQSIGTFSFPTSTSGGAQHAPIDLSTTTALQNVAAGTPVKFRIVPSGGTNTTTGTWYVFSTGLQVMGTVNNISAPLPLNLISFNGTTKGILNELTWVTANEQNVAAFELQRGKDGTTFDKVVTTIAAKGNNSDARNTYSYDDNNNVAGQTLYYRLKMADRNNDFTYSNIVVIRNSTNQNAVKLYPNPTSGTLYLEGLQGQGSYSILDATGRTLRQEQLDVQKGTAVSISTSGLSQGVYFLHYTDGNFSGVIRFMKK
jgi:hypothetical protein